MSTQQQAVTKEKPNDLIARVIVTIGMGLALFSFLQASTRGSRYGYEEALLFLAPAIVLALVAIGMKRSRRVVAGVAATVALVVMHIFA